MAKKTSSESVDETAFQALEEALKIDFNGEQPRARPTQTASETRVGYAKAALPIVLTKSAIRSASSGRSRNDSPTARFRAGQ